MKPIEHLEHAVASSKQVLAGVKPENMDGSSPCLQWDVRQVVNHMIGANNFFIGAMGGAPIGADGADYASGDYCAAFDEVSAASVAAFNAPGAMEKTVVLPWGPTPAEGVLAMAATDIFTHGWDLAKATGRSTDLDAELAANLLEGCRASIQPGFRGDDASGMPFGLEQQAPAGASKADELAAFLGRIV